MQFQESSSSVFLGFDPGGNHKYGVAKLVGSHVLAETVDTIEDAVSWAIESCVGTIPAAAGVDTLLHWATGQSGLRAADQYLKDSYPKVIKSVIAPNSLYGAMTLGGMGLAFELRTKWPRICLNETHPKVLYHALSQRFYPRKEITEAVEWLQKHTGCQLNKSIRNDHELDAVLSAWTTRQALKEGWRDLAVLPPKHGQHIFPLKGVNYYWPPR